MNDQNKPKVVPWKLPLLLIIAVLMILGMIRLGIWQLSRADEKQLIVEQLKQKSELPALTQNQLFELRNSNDLRFRKVSLEGRYDTKNTVFVDNQVVNGQVGYQVFTPLLIEGREESLMVARGFVAIGKSRAVLPEVKTSEKRLQVSGRLNKPPAKPPLWDEDYPVADGARWQFLPISELAEQLHLDLLPLVVELAPIKDGEDSTNDNLIRKWSAIDDQWVAKHQGYAFQWFAMAVAFFIACLVLVIRRPAKQAR